MSWQLLLYLACPLMMLFCMKGMFMGHKDKKNKEAVNVSSSAQDIQSLQIQMAELMEENKRLEREIQSVKNGSEIRNSTLKVISSNDR